MPIETTVEKARNFEGQIAKKLKSPSAMLIPPDVKEMIAGMAALVTVLATEIESLTPYVDEG